MARATYPIRTLVVSLLIAGVCVGQERALQRLKEESARLRQTSPPSDSDLWKEIKEVRDRSANLHTAVRDWIESLLPKSRAALDAEYSFLSTKLNAELQRAGLASSESSRDIFGFKPGTITGVEISRPGEDPDKLVVTVGVEVPCGDYDVAYVYDYSQGSPRRVLESVATRDHDESLSDVRFSKRDASGNQLILTLRYAVQCGSTWNMLSYDLFRVSAIANVAAPILAGEHGIWFGTEDPYQLRLEPDELLLEVRDRSIDAGIHNRPMCCITNCQIRWLSALIQLPYSRRISLTSGSPGHGRRWNRDRRKARN